MLVNDALLDPGNLIYVSIVRIIPSSVLYSGDLFYEAPSLN